MPTHYKIYKHTFKTSKKSYIGFTSKTITERLHKHYINALAGLDTKFCRAIRKYGIDNIRSKLLAECFTEDEAQSLEIHFIEKYDTFKNGYNMTLGGDGGNTRKNLTHYKLRKYSKKLSMSASGKGNPNYSGITDDEIIDCAIKYYNSSDSFCMRKWMRFSKRQGLPQYYTDFRFAGKGIAGFKEILCEKLGVKIGDLEYIRNDEHKEKLRIRTMNKRKVNRNGLWTVIEKEELDNYINDGWVRGRGNLNNKYFRSEK